MSHPVDGKVILVTGAASGIGAATARLAAARGAKVIATDIDGEGVSAVAGQIGGHGLVHDVTDPVQWDAAISAAVAHHGRLDGLVSNAGIVNYEPIVDLDMERFRALVGVQVEATFLGLQKAVAQMRAQAGDDPAQGSIVVNASVMANHVAPGIASYATVKAAIANMAKAVGVELGRKGDFIRVNTVAPGPVRTPLLEGAMGMEAMQDPASWGDVPLGNPCEAEDVAETILFLLSEESSFMTSAQMVVDGGWSLT